MGSYVSVRSVEATPLNGCYVSVEESVAGLKFISLVKFKWSVRVGISYLVHNVDHLGAGQSIKVSTRSCR